MVTLVTLFPECFTMRIQRCRPSRLRITSMPAAVRLGRISLIRRVSPWAVALVMALGRAIVQPEGAASVYETRGILTL